MGFAELVPAGAYRDTGPDFARVGDWLRHFDADFYREHHTDLSGLPRDALYRHFVEAGWREGRSYSRFLHSFIAPEFYRARYPELRISTDAEAVRHWMFAGYYEGRSPNEVSDAILDSEFHLFQFGKVGSQAVADAIQAAGNGRMVLHLHWPSDMLVAYPDCVWTYPEVVRRTRARPLTFITGVRDPFARIISGYFESAASVGALDAMNFSQIETEIVRASFEDGQMNWLLQWFEHQFFRGVDVYQHEFDKSAGYGIVETDDTRLFIYRLENLPNLDEPLSEFTGLRIRLPEVNRAAAKDYAPAYEAVSASLRFARSDVSRVLDSPYVRHFYTEHEIDSMRSRWTSA
jgi:hypothetical protein